MKIIYSSSDILKLKNINETKNIQKKNNNNNAFINLELLKTSIYLPIITISKNNHNHNNRHNNHHNKFNRSSKEWVRKPPTKPLNKAENAWKVDILDDSEIKKIRAILNKLSLENFDIMVNDTLLLNYTAPIVVDEIFNKAICEPFYSDMYARFCMSLVKLHFLIKDMCKEQFIKKKHKNLCKFIGELYKLKIITELDIFIDVLYENLDDQNLEILCELITTVGVKNKIFEDILIQLEETKDFFKPRYKFMIMDVLEKQ